MTNKFYVIFTKVSDIKLYFTGDYSFEYHYPLLETLGKYVPIMLDGVKKFETLDEAYLEYGKIIDYHDQNGEKFFIELLTPETIQVYNSSIILI